LFAFSFVEGMRGQSPGIAVGPVKVGRTTKREYTTCINVWRDRRALWKSYTSRNINVT